jgi:hypothetical protein
MSILGNSIRLRRTMQQTQLFATRWARKVAILLAVTAILSLQVSGQQLRQGFLNPSADARPIMRWWWFGPSVTKPELKKELETMRAAGMGGVEIQPVYPLAVDGTMKGVHNFPYLSPEFLGDLTFANATARALGLRVDITLGSGWPYGGPGTTLSLAAGRLKVVPVPITASTVTPPALVEGDSLIAAFAVSGTAKDFDPASARRIDPATNAVPPAKETQTALFFIASHTRQAVKRPGVGAEGFVLDHFSRAAIDEHLTGVAAPLLKAFGSQPPYAVFSDSLEVYGSDWTREFPAECQRRRGYDLIPHLPELFAGSSAEADAVRHDWGQTLSDLVRENYLAPVTNFAVSHGTKFRSQTYGEPAVTLADEAVPNLPEGEGPQWRAFSFTRWATSASHLYGRDVTSAETWTWLHSPAFRATPLDMKVEADRMFLLGVNQIVGHGYPYSPAAAGEPGWAFYAAGALNAHNPWFPVMPDVMGYLQRVSWLLRQGKPANDIAILLPEDDAQAAFTLGHVSVTVEMKKLISPELMATVLDAGYNIDYIDAATINKLGTIPYPVLLLPATKRIPLETYKKIASYATNGGKLLATGRLPTLAPGLKQQSDSREITALSTKLFESSDHAGVLVGSIGELADALHRALPPDLKATGQVDGLGFIHRKLTDSDVYFVANTSNRPIEGSVRFRSARTVAEAWNPESGEILEKIHLRNGSAIPLTLAPYESRVFVLQNKFDDGPEKSIGKAQSTRAEEKQSADLSKGWQIQFSSGSSHENLDKLISWPELPGKQYYSGEAVYSRAVSIDRPLAPDVHLFLDFGAGTPTTDTRSPNALGTLALLSPPIREAAIVFVNGKKAGSLWHPPYRIDISKLVHRGENRIEVHVYNTAINELAGQPARDYSDLNAKYGKRFRVEDMENLQPLPSGLFGPITLVERSK